MGPFAEIGDHISLPQVWGISLAQLVYMLSLRTKTGMDLDPPPSGLLQ